MDSLFVVYHTMFEKNEEKLIIDLKKGSVRAFDKIYEIYARRLYAFCLKYCKSKETAEEIMQDTFVWIWNNRLSITQTETLKPIIFIRAKHLLINAYRKVINSPVYEDYMDYLDKGDSSAYTSMMEYDEFVQRVNLLISQLSKTQQEIIKLSKFEMMTNKEIAQKLNYSEQTVKNQLSLGLKQLRNMLGMPLSILAYIFLT